MNKGVAAVSCTDEGEEPYTYYADYVDELREENKKLRDIIKDVIKSCRENGLDPTALEIERQLKEVR